MRREMNKKNKKILLTFYEKGSYEEINALLTKLKISQRKQFLREMNFLTPEERSNFLLKIKEI